MRPTEEPDPGMLRVDRWRKVPLLSGGAGGEVDEDEDEDEDDEEDGADDGDEEEGEEEEGELEVESSSVRSFHRCTSESLPTVAQTVKEGDPFP